MQKLRTKHHEYKDAQKHFGGSTLKRRLARRECLDNSDATGDCFNKLIEEFKRKEALKPLTQPLQKSWRGELERSDGKPDHS